MEDNLIRSDPIRSNVDVLICACFVFCFVLFFSFLFFPFGSEKTNEEFRIESDDIFSH